jgi:carboxyl-terminal processing protease
MGAPRPTISAFYPLALALTLVAGMFIGRDIGGGSSLPGRVFRIHEPSPATKISEVLDLIDRQYVDTVEKKALVDEVLQDLLQRLDPHSYYITAEELRAAQEPLEGSFDGIGVEFAIQRDTVVVITPVEGGPSEALGIRAGDRILKADSTTLAGVGIRNEDVMRNLRGPKGSTVVVTLLRGGRKEAFTVSITRGKVPINSVAAAILTSDGSGYIKLVRFAKNTHEEFLTAADNLRQQGMQRLVLDLRGNGGGFLNSAIELADEFLPRGRTIVYTQGRNSPRRDITASSAGSYEDIPLAVLIDEGSASASEIIAGAVQDNDRGMIVGRRSFGKGLVQEHVDLPDESAVRLTTARYYTPSGRSIQRPYGQGIDYEQDLEARYEHGEFLSVDSIRIDSSQVFSTLKGRKVFGGGGIMPDIFVPTDTAEGSNYLTELFFSGALNSFAFEVADRERDRLSALGSEQAFTQNYQVSNSLLQELERHATEQGIAIDPKDAARSERQIRLRLKAGIARNIWGNAGFYRIMLDTDSIYLKALDQLLGAPRS